MVVKVHGSPLSSPTLRVVAAAYEKELDFEFVHVDFESGAHKQLPHLALNPFGQVPAFEDGDLQPFESRAIKNYITHTYERNGTTLISKDMKQKAIQAVWMEVEAHQFDPTATKLVWELVFKAMFGMQPPDMAIVEENEAKLAKVLDVYEARLSQTRYLGGETFTLADLHHLPQMNRLMSTGVKKLFDERPCVSTWCSDILARPAWKKTVELAETSLRS